MCARGGSRGCTRTHPAGSAAGAVEQAPQPQAATAPAAGAAGVPIAAANGSTRALGKRRAPAKQRNTVQTFSDLRSSPSHAR